MGGINTQSITINGYITQGYHLCKALSYYSFSYGRGGIIGVDAFKRKNKNTLFMLCVSMAKRGGENGEHEAVKRR